MSSLGPNGEEIPDGFRPRRKRTKTEIAHMIKAGIVANPAVGVPERQRSDNEHVVAVETATAIGKKE